MPAGNVAYKEAIVKKNSIINIDNSASEKIDFTNDLLECIEVVFKYILSKKRGKIKQKMHEKFEYVLVYSLPKNNYVIDYSKKQRRKRCFLMTFCLLFETKPGRLFEAYRSLDKKV